MISRRRLFFGKQSHVLAKSIFWFSLLFTTIESTEGVEFSEDQIKAVYLLNFAEFIRWPDKAFSEHPKKFCYCALHADTSVIRILKKVIANETVKGRKLTFKQINNSKDQKHCQVVFFQQSEKSQFVKLLPELKQNSVLTVSDDINFVKQGGMIAITKGRRRLYPTINLKNLEKSGLRVSAKLLRLAKVLEGR